MACNINIIIGSIIYIETHNNLNLNAADSTFWKIKKAYESIVGEIGGKIGFRTFIVLCVCIAPQIGFTCNFLYRSWLFVVKKKIEALYFLLKKKKKMKKAFALTFGKVCTLTKKNPENINSIPCYDESAHTRYFVYIII